LVKRVGFGGNVFERVALGFILSKTRASMVNAALIGRRKAALSAVPLKSFGELGALRAA